MLLELSISQAGTHTRNEKRHRVLPRCPILLSRREEGLGRVLCLGGLPAALLLLVPVHEWDLVRIRTCEICFCTFRVSKQVPRILFRFYAIGCEVVRDFRSDIS